MELLEQTTPPSSGLREKEEGGDDDDNDDDDDDYGTACIGKPSSTCSPSRLLYDGVIPDLEGWRLRLIRKETYKIRAGHDFYLWHGVHGYYRSWTTLRGKVSPKLFEKLHDFVIQQV